MAPVLALLLQFAQLFEAAVDAGVVPVERRDRVYELRVLHQILGLETQLLPVDDCKVIVQDVYEDEPRITTALVSLPNVVLLPHIGSATIEGRLEMGDKVIINIQTFWDGHTPRDRVIEAML